MAERITFALAMLGFVLLTRTAWSAAGGRVPRGWLAVTAVVVVTHVVMVWTVRYEGSFAEATRNGYAGFALFHAALLSLVLANFVAVRSARWFVLFTFGAVCLGANGAVWRYAVVEVYRVPVIACTVVGVVLVGRGWYRARAAEPRG